MSLSALSGLARLAAISVVAAGIGTVGWWLVSTIEAKERLEVSLQMAEQANSTYQAAYAKLLRLKEESEKLLAERNKQAQIARARASELQRRLRDVVSQITVEQQACMGSDIPAPVLDILRHESPERGDQPADGAGLSSRRAVRANADA